MASSSAPVHPYRYLTLFLVLLIGAYLLVFLTGDKQAKPKLGIDLQGGTRVTLTARTPDGSAPTREALTQAQEIISSRVNGLGVSGSEVVIFQRKGYPAHSIYAITPNAPIDGQIVPFSYPGLDRAKVPTFLYLWQPDPTLLRLGGR